MDQLLLVFLGGCLSIGGGYWAAHVGATASTAQLQRQLDHQWRRTSDADLRAFQEAIIDLIEALQREYAHAATAGLDRLTDWLPLDSYGALVRADMLRTRVRANNVVVTWEYLRSDIEQRRTDLFVVLAAFNSPLRDVFLSEEAKPLLEHQAHEMFNENLFGLRETIEKHRRLGEEFVIAYRSLPDSAQSQR